MATVITALPSDYNPGTDTALAGLYDPTNSGVPALDNSTTVSTNGANSGWAQAVGSIGQDILGIVGLSKGGTVTQVGNNSQVTANPYASTPNFTTNGVLNTGMILGIAVIGLGAMWLFMHH